MDELAKRFADLAAQYGPQVAEAAKAAARVEAYSGLALASLLLVVAGVCIWTVRFLWRKVHDEDDPWDKDWFFAVTVLSIVGAVLMFIGVGIWTDPWTWVMINHPELWLAKKAFHL